MCRKLKIPRSLVYYKRKTRKIDSRLENAVIKIFKDSHNNYGSRKIKVWTIVNKVDRKKVKKVLQIEWEIKGH